MGRLKNILYYARLVDESAKELQNALGYREELQRLKELEFYSRQLSVEIEHFQNVIRQHFQKETGLRAFDGIWQRLNVRKSEQLEGSPPPERRLDT